MALILCSGKCKKQIPEDKAIQCDLCTEMSCLACAEMSEDMYNLIIQTRQESRMHYFCKKCNNTAVDTIKMMSGLKEKMDSVEKQVSAIAISVKNVEESVTKVTSTVNSVV